MMLHQLKHKQLPPQIEFAILHNNSLTSVHYLIQHEEILPHQKHDSHPTLAEYGTDQFSIRTNDKGNDIIVKPLDAFSFKSIMIMMSLVMTMIIYTLVLQNLLNFHPLIKPMIHIKHPLLHVLTVLLPSQNKNHLHYQPLLLIQLNLLNFLHTRLKYHPSTTLPSLNTKLFSRFLSTR